MADDVQRQQLLLVRRVGWHLVLPVQAADPAMVLTDLMNQQGDKARSGSETQQVSARDSSGACAAVAKQLTSCTMSLLLLLLVRPAGREMRQVDL